MTDSKIYETYNMLKINQIEYLQKRIYKTNK